jgi:hypothetical protein
LASQASSGKVPDTLPYSSFEECHFLLRSVLTACENIFHNLEGFSKTALNSFFWRSRRALCHKDVQINMRSVKDFPFFGRIFDERPFLKLYKRPAYQRGYDSDDAQGPHRNLDSHVCRPG